MASCFRCFKPWRHDDHLKEERLKAFKELEDIQAGDGPASVEGDLKTPDIAATVMKKGEKVDCDLECQSNPESASSTDGERALQQAEKPADVTVDIAASPAVTGPGAGAGAVSSSAKGGRRVQIGGEPAGEQRSSSSGGATADAPSTSVCSPSCATTAATASCSGYTPSISGGGGSSADPAAPTPTTPAPPTAVKQPRSPTSSRNGWGVPGTPWYPPGPNVVHKPLSSPPRSSSSGSGKALAQAGVVPPPPAGPPCRQMSSPATRSYGDGPATGGHQRGAGGVATSSRNMRLYGGSMGLPVGRTTTPPPPPGVFTSASTRLALHDVLHRRSRGLVGIGGSGRSGVSVNGLSNIDFRPRWRY